MTEIGLLNRVVQKGALINYVGFFSGKLIVFANTVILARLLAPEHFGLVAIGLLILTISEAITEAGTGAAVVWRAGSLQENAAVAMSIALIGAVVMAGLAMLMAPMAADVFGQPDATGVIRVLAICILFSSPTAVFSAILQKRFQFGRRLIPEIARAVIKGAVGISLALAGFGVWSLVYSQVAAVVIGLALSWWLSGWRPRLSLERSILRDVLPYAAHITSIGLLGVAAKKLDVVIVGYQFPAEMLGFYTLAFTLVELGVMGICWSAGQSLFPALSQTGQDGEKIEAIFAQGLSVLLAITVPLAVGMAVVAEPFILAIFGEKWAPASVLTQVIAFYALIYSAGFNLGDVYKATGRPQVLSWINALNLLFAVPILLIGSHWGVIGVAIGQVLVAFVISGVNWAAASRLAGIGPKVLIHALMAPAIAALGAATVCILIDYFLLASSTPLWTLIVQSLLGLASYTAFLFALKPEFLLTVQRVLRKKAAVPIASDKSHEANQ